MDISWTNKPKSTFKVSKYQLQNFLSLSKSGLDILTVLKLSFPYSDQIIDELNQGRALSQIFLEHSNDSLFHLLHILSGHMSFEQALDCANVIEQSSKKRKQKFIIQIAYPLFLFLFSYALILFFSNSIVPSMMTYAENSSFVIIDLLSALYTLILFFLIVILFLFILRKRVKRIARIFSSIYYVKVYRSILFSYIWKSLLSNGLVTSECFYVMEDIPETKDLAKSLNACLAQGFTLLEAISNAFKDLNLFYQFIETGMASSNLIHLLEIYNQRQEKEMDVILKKISKSIQLFSYLCVAIVVFVFYQVMLLPLNMLNTF